ncbi:MAG: glycosyltransferase family 39 protein [Victivallales bacterium]
MKRNQYKNKITILLLLTGIIFNLYLNLRNGSVASEVYGNLFGNGSSKLTKIALVDSLMADFHEGKIFLEFEGFNIKDNLTWDFAPFKYYRSVYQYYPGEIHTGNPDLIINRGTEFLLNPVKADDEWLKGNKFNYSIKYKLLQDGEILTEVKEISTPDPSHRHFPEKARLVFLSMFTIGIFVILFSILFLQMKKTPFQLTFNKKDFLALFSVTVILIMFLIVTGDSLLMPVYNGDAFGIWMLKAKVLFHEGFGSNYFHNPNMGYSHLDYPLLVPMLISGVYSMLGYADDSYGKIIYPLIYLLFVGLIFSAARRRLDLEKSLLLTALFASIPALVRWSGTGTADMVLTFFYAGSILHLIIFIGRKNTYDLILSAFYSSLCILTKNEGLPLALINAFTLIIFCSIPNRNIKFFFTYISLLTIPCLPWFIFSCNIPKIHENSLATVNLAHFAENIARLKIIIPAFFSEYSNVQNWGILWAMTVVFGFAGWKHLKNKTVAILFLLFILHTSLYVFIYVIYPYSLGWLLAMTLDRLILHTTPAILLILTYLLYGEENPQ